MNRFRIGTKYEYCPNGNYWQEISGFFDNEIYLFCDCNKCSGSVYRLRPVNVTKKIKKEVVERARKINELDDLRGKINLKNLDEVKKKLPSL